MIFMEQPDFLTESEVYHMIQESALTDKGRLEIKEKILDPIFKVLETKSGMKKYMDLGNEFIDLNADMLAKQYPTTRVVYPRRYVDSVLEIFGFTVADMKRLIKDILQTHVNASDWNSIVAYPSNIIHTAVLIYSDMSIQVDMNNPNIKNNRNLLRDSARQQFGMTSYQMAFATYFPSPPNPSVMEYTYNHLDRSWNLVKDEDMVTWIGESIETSYQFYRNKIALSLTPQLLADFLNRVRNTFRQNLRTLAHKYYEDIDAGHGVAQDTDESSEIETSELTKLRTNLVRRIRNGDELYKKMNKTYVAIANLKQVKPPELLYNFAQRVQIKDISTIIDLILYVFITKEGNNIKDINSSKYISRITKFPTACDRAIPGKALLVPMQKKYNEKDTIVKAYICYLATYILQRINDVQQVLF